MSDRLPGRRDAMSVLNVLKPPHMADEEFGIIARTL
jgi:hypothetical protein